MLTFIKKEPVLSAAGAAAVISAFFVRPSVAYLEYIDYSVLILLFCLMSVVAGLMKTKLFDCISARILRSSDKCRTVGILLVNITFLSAMLITNDVALITLVPFTAGIFGKKKSLIPLVVMETAAANLGSMIMPFGNPQNLYLYSRYNMSIGDFSGTILPYGILSLALVNVFTFFLVKDERIGFDSSKKVHIENKRNFVIYIILFIVCILTVLRVVNIYICLAAVVLCFTVTDRKIFAEVDWLLLLTFCAFFVFVGNLGNIDAVRKTLSAAVNGHEFVAAVLSSQVISNVPAAIMLSGFTDNARELLIGVNLGGLGTLVASLASVISYKQYMKTENAEAGKYMLVFSSVNFSLLVIISAVYFLFSCQVK
ncbi:MAG: SLC13 family permease [Oscillospiraceae bacterium]|nr:SLC13 family permease [Oscillospiraceae bacterium]